MRETKQRWTAEEEAALLKGIDKHGPGKWENIQKDPEFNHLLYPHSDIDLRNKWRNLSAIRRGCREKSPTAKSKPNSDVPNPIQSRL